MHFARTAHDCEVDIFTSFYNLLYSVRVRWEGEDKIWWAFSKREHCLMSDPFTISWVVVKALIFPCKSIWWTKALLRVASFVWSAALGNIITMDSLRKHNVLWLTSVVCVKRMRSPWTISLFIVRLIEPYGMCFLTASGYLGLYLDELLICLLVGRLLVALRVSLCGRW